MTAVTPEVVEDIWNRDLIYVRPDDGVIVWQSILTKYLRGQEPVDDLLLIVEDNIILDSDEGEIIDWPAVQRHFADLALEAARVGADLRQRTLWGFDGS